MAAPLLPPMPSFAQRAPEFSSELEEATQVNLSQLLQQLRVSIVSSPFNGDPSFDPQVLVRLKFWARVAVNQSEIIRVLTGFSDAIVQNPSMGSVGEWGLSAIVDMVQNDAETCAKLGVLPMPQINIGPGSSWPNSRMQLTRHRLGELQILGLSAYQVPNMLFGLLSILTGIEGLFFKIPRAPLFFVTAQSHIIGDNCVRREFTIRLASNQPGISLGLEFQVTSISVGGGRPSVSLRVGAKGLDPERPDQMMRMPSSKVS